MGLRLLVFVVASLCAWPASAQVRTGAAKSQATGALVAAPDDSGARPFEEAEPDVRALRREAYNAAFAQEVRAGRDVLHGRVAALDAAGAEVVVERVFQGGLKAGKRVRVTLESCPEDLRLQHMVRPHPQVAAPVALGDRLALVVERVGDEARCVARVALWGPMYWGGLETFVDVMASQASWSDEAPLVAARALAQRLEAQLEAALNPKASCLLDPSMTLEVMVWPDGRRVARYKFSEDSGFYDGRTCVERLLDQLKAGPAFEGGAVSGALKLSYPMASSRLKVAVSWSACGDACEGPQAVYLPAREGITPAALLDAAQPTQEEPLSQRDRIERLGQLCLSRGLGPTQELVEQERKVARGPLAERWIEQELWSCAARWEEARALEGFAAAERVQLGELGALIITLARWDGVSADSLVEEGATQLKEPKLDAGELYRRLFLRQLPRALTLSPWLLHAQGALLARLAPAREQEAALSLLVAAQLARPEHQERYRAASALIGAQALASAQAKAQRWQERWEGYERDAAALVQARQQQRVLALSAIEEAREGAAQAVVLAYRDASRGAPRAKPRESEGGGLRDALALAIAGATLVMVGLMIRSANR